MKIELRTTLTLRYAVLGGIEFRYGARAADNAAISIFAESRSAHDQSRLFAARSSKIAMPFGAEGMNVAFFCCIIFVKPRIVVCAVFGPLVYALKVTGMR